jgi:hypothetical protein
MIKKSLFAALMFLILHALVVHFSGIGNSQHIWQDNINKAQRYIYSKDTLMDVIVGSSLSNRLIMDSLPGLYNLSLQGQNVYDGLAIIFRKEQLPKTIYLEMNIVLGKENKTFTSSLFSPILYNIRKYFPSLRDEYQPVGQLGRVVMNSIGKINPDSKILKSPPVSEEVFNKIINLKCQDYSVVPEAEVLENRSAILKEYVSVLENRGTEVIFFEMPVNEKLARLPMPCKIRETFNSTFPPEKYKYIQLPDYKDYRTRDGEHLSPEEALLYTCYFRSKITESNLTAERN